jgi:hypothetical protein
VKSFLFSCLAGILLLGAASTACAQTILSEGFDSPAGANGDVYFTDSLVSYNGITDGTSSGAITTGASFAGNANENGEIINSVTAGYGNISAPQAGGFFLYQNTTAAFSGGTVVWAGQSVAVTTNTNYTFSFYLTNQDLTSIATIQPMINGVADGALISATGTNTWEEFSVNYFSGASTSAIFELDNTNQAGNGNDFGIDSISVTAVPEPRQYALFALLLTLGLIVAHRRWNDLFKPLA